MAHRYLTVSSSPHLRQGRTIRGLITVTLIALVPAMLLGFYQFGPKAVLLVGLGITGAVGTEAALCVVTKKPLTIKDHHALLVGLMLALLVPVGAPWWLVLVGAALAILVGKAPFGPLGGAPINPVLVGLLIVSMSWPDAISSYEHPLSAPEIFAAADAAPAEAPQDAVTIDPSDVGDYCLGSLFLGNQAGAIGAVSPLLAPVAIEALG